MPFPIINISSDLGVSEQGYPVLEMLLLQEMRYPLQKR